jgi:hypothetical protein
VGNDDGHFYWPSPVERKYKQVFFPGVTDPGRATVIEVSAGSETSNVDITVDGPTRTFAASGVVLDEQANQPAPNMQIWMSSPPTEFVPLKVISNSRGQFRIENLTPGDYQVRVNPEEGDDVRSSRVSFQIADRDIDGLVIKTGKGAGIAGVVVLENNKDPLIMDKLRRLSVGAWNHTGGDSATLWHSSPINADHSFSLKGLDAGTAFFDIDHSEEGFSLARIEYPNATPTGSIPVNSSDQITGVRLIVRYGTAIIEGTVKIVNGKLPTDCRLYVSVREITALDRLLPVEVDDRGHFTIRNLAAGTYFVTPNLSTPGAMNPVGAPQQVVVNDAAAVNVILTADLGKGPETGGPIGRSLSVRSAAPGVSFKVKRCTGCFVPLFVTPYTSSSERHEVFPIVTKPRKNKNAGNVDLSLDQELPAGGRSPCFVGVPLPLLVAYETQSSTLQ